MPESPSPLEPTSVADLIRSRRTIHQFAPTVPPRATILRAIDVARWAPNHRLTEPWHFYLLGRKTAEAIAHLNAERITSERGVKAGEKKRLRWLAIPGWLVVTCRRAEDPVRAREDYAACACALQNFQLYLWSEGIGVKWTTGDVTQDPLFYPLLGIDPGQEALVGMMWYGYPAEIPTTQRKPVESIVTELP